MTTKCSSLRTRHSWHLIDVRATFCWLQQIWSWVHVWNRERILSDIWWVISIYKSSFCSINLLIWFDLLEWVYGHLASFFQLVESIFNFDSFLRLSFLLPLLATTENEKVLLKVFRNGSMIRSGKKILVGNKPFNKAVRKMQKNLYRMQFN